MQQCTGRHFHNAEWWWSYAAAAIRIATVRAALADYFLILHFEHPAKHWHVRVGAFGFMTSGTAGTTFSGSSILVSASGVVCSTFTSVFVSTDRLSSGEIWSGSDIAATVAPPKVVLQSELGRDWISAATAFASLATAETFVAALPLSKALLHFFTPTAFTLSSGTGFACEAEALLDVIATGFVSTTIFFGATGTCCGATTTGALMLPPMLAPERVIGILYTLGDTKEYVVVAACVCGTFNGAPGVREIPVLGALMYREGPVLYTTGGLELYLTCDVATGDVATGVVHDPGARAEPGYCVTTGDVATGERTMPPLMLLVLVGLSATERGKAISV